MTTFFFPIFQDDTLPPCPYPPLPPSLASTLSGLSFPSTLVNLPLVYALTTAHSTHVPHTSVIILLRHPRTCFMCIISFPPFSHFLSFFIYIPACTYPAITHSTCLNISASLWIFYVYLFNCWSIFIYPCRYQPPLIKKIFWDIPERRGF